MPQTGGARPSSSAPHPTSLTSAAAEATPPGSCRGSGYGGCEALLLQSHGRAPPRAPLGAGAAGLRLEQP